MAVFKCKMCGGTLERQNNETVLTCDFCGTQQTLPKTSDDNIANLFNRANNLRLKCEFDKAAQIYEKIVEQDDSEAEAHWGIVLCKYGIEYVEDPKTNKRIPTCHRTLFEAITTDPDYQAAIDYSDFAQQDVYKAEAKAIDKIQRDILAVVKNEKPFDVFICYKETDASGSRTRDSVIANDIYYQLTNEGYKVFYAAITLEDKLGQEYEPYIFAALNSAKVMLVVGTQPEYFTAVWVKNEWSRFLQLMKSDRSKLLIPCYRDMDAYELPEEFAHLQAQDMNKIGFINDLVRGIQKVIKKDEPKPQIETVIQTVSAPNVAAKANDVTVDSLLKRAFIFLGDSDWQNANEYCERVLDIDPENAQAYLGKLMVERHIRRIENLPDQQSPYDYVSYYQKAVKYADASLKRKLTEANETIKERNRTAELDRIYRSACEKMQRAEGVLKGTSSYSRDFMRNIIPEAISLFNDARNYKNSSACIEQCKDILYKYAVARKDGASSRDAYLEAKKDFMAITGYNNYRDCNRLIQACSIAADEAEKEEIYRRALSKGRNATTSDEYLYVINTLKGIRDYKDVNAELKRYEKLYDEKLAEEKEAARIEQERKAKELKKLARQEKRRRTIITLLIIAGIAAVLVGLCFLAGIPNETLLVICCVVGLIVGIVVGIVFVNNVFGGGGCLGYIITIGICYFLAALVLVLFMSGIQFITGNTPTMLGYLSNESDSGDMYVSEIVQKYSGSYSTSTVSGTGSLNITSCDKNGKVTGTFSFKVDGYEGEYKITGQITKITVSQVILTIRAGEWIKRPNSSFVPLEDMEVTIYNSYKNLECSKYNMRWTAITGGSSSNSNGEILTAITLKTNIQLATIGDIVTLSFSPTPSSPKYAITGQNEQRDYNPECIEYYVRINGEDVRLNTNRQTAIEYKFETSGEHVFWAKYCQHSSPCSSSYDIVSQEIKIVVSGNAISSPADLKKLSNSSDEFELTGDIDMSGVDFAPIVGFTGVLDGKGYSIKNLTINSSESNVGLFSTLEGTVKNLKIENATVTVTGRNENIGILCGTLKGTAENILTSGTVTADIGTNVGGIAGYVSKSSACSISGLENQADITAKEKVGGVFGNLDNKVDSSNSHESSISALKNSGNITATENYAGGIVGYLSAYNSYSTHSNYVLTLYASALENTGNISGTLYVGGLVGYGETDSVQSKIEDSSNKSAVTAEAYVGCIAGKLVSIKINSCTNDTSTLSATKYVIVEGKKYAYVGGFVGYGYIASNCTNTVTIAYSSSGMYVGGIMGYCDLSNVYITSDNLENTADISGADYVGGLFGMLSNVIDSSISYESSISSYKNSGTIKATGNYAGGLFGYLYVNNKYSTHSNYVLTLYASDLENTGKVSGKKYVGGLIGYGVTDSSKSKVIDYVATGTVTATSNYGKRYGYAENLIFE